MATAALIISILALLLAASRWVLDLWRGEVSLRRRGGRHERVALRVELLADGTNSFVIRGGYTLIFLSMRVYNESEQREATVSRIAVEMKHERRWRRLEAHPSEEAYIFGSLARNALPTHLTPGQSEDFYEAYQLPDLVSKTTARVRVRVADYTGAQATVEDSLSLRLDDRPALDILFQTLDLRPEPNAKPSGQAPFRPG